MATYPVVERSEVKQLEPWTSVRRSNFTSSGERFPGEQADGIVGQLGVFKILVWKPEVPLLSPPVTPGITKKITRKGVVIPTYRHGMPPQARLSGLWQGDNATSRYFRCLKTRVHHYAYGEDITLSKGGFVLTRGNVSEEKKAVRQGFIVRLRRRFFEVDFRFVGPGAL
jgi:hypothetical protein